MHPRSTNLSIYFQRHMIAMLALGFSSGLPFLLTLGTLSARLKSAGIDNTSIGFASWIGFAYGFKYLWSPMLDRCQIPILTKLMGQRRSWMVFSQLLIMAGIIGMAVSDPSTSMMMLIGFAIFTAIGSATQDIAVDAWRIEAAAIEQQGHMAATYQLGYRLAIMASGGGALILADKHDWHFSYFVMALLMLIGIFAAAYAPKELENKRQEIFSVKTALVDPFIDFFVRYKSTAFFMLALISSYRIPDFVMGVMARPFYLDKGYTLTMIGEISGFYGVWITIIGAFMGGLLVTRLGLIKTLLIGAVLGSGSNLMYVWLGTQDIEYNNLLACIAVENLSGGIAGTALIAYMSSLTNTAFTATQYALLSSFYALLAKFIGGYSGKIVDAYGFSSFFLLTALIGVPAIILVLYVAARGGIKKMPQVK